MAPLDIHVQKKKKKINILIKGLFNHYRRNERPFQILLKKSHDPDFCFREVGYFEMEKEYVLYMRIKLPFCAVESNGQIIMD